MSESRLAAWRRRSASSPPVQEGRPIWSREGRDWPLREASRFIEAGGLRWHVQVLGRGPVALLLHGTGAATHSWRGLAPLLAGSFTVVAPDLPGHGFTAMPATAGLSLPGMARGLRDLLGVLGMSPDLAIGHSAGAAILLRMGIDGTIAPRRIVSLNGALLPLGGMAGHLFSPLARLVATTSLVPRLFAWHVRADSKVVPRLIADTGSTLDGRGIELYARLARCPGHVAGAFGMMANWDLQPLASELPGLRTPLTLVVGGGDRTIRPSEARRARVLLPSAEEVRLPGLGHLAHEERPAMVADVVMARQPTVAGAG